MGKEKYSGILNTPLPVTDDPEQGANEIFRRVEALCDHYEIKREITANNLFQLVLVLARDHVPGFTLEKQEKTFREGAWKDVVLLREMITYIQAGRSKRNAARLTVNKHPDLGWSAESARVRFTEMTTKGGRKSSRQALIRALALINSMSESRKD